MTQRGFVPPVQNCQKQGPLDAKQWIRFRRAPGVSARAGFTIIELLVVVAIIALLASLVIIRLDGVRARTRDAQREQHMKTLQSALTLYATSRRLFPVYSGTITGTDAVSAALLNDGVIAAIPLDPLNTGDYVYSYVSATGQTYAINYTLETNSIAGKTAGAQSVAP